MPLNGVVMTVEEAGGLLPRHPNCRCCWVPANVGEEKGERPQQRGKAKIEQAIDASYEAEASGGTTLEEQKEKSSWGGADKVIARQRPESVFNVFCATGEGGGVDPTCSPDGGTKEDPEVKRASIKKRLKEAGFNDLTESIKLQLHQPVYDELMEAKRLFPGLQSISIVPSSLGKDTPLTYREEGGSHRLLVDETNDPAEIEPVIVQSQKSGWLASEGGLQGVVAHEIGHIIDMTPFSTSRNWRHLMAARKYIRSNPPSKADLSGYAAEAGPHQREEMFAEAYSAFRTKRSPNRWQQGFNQAIGGGASTRNTSRSTTDQR
jgi:hypothetical protein